MPHTNTPTLNSTHSPAHLTAPDAIPAASTPRMSSRIQWRAILRALVADISKSGFVMTFLAIVALVFSAWSLRVALEQQAPPSVIAPTYFTIDALTQPHFVKPVYREDQLQGDASGSAPAICQKTPPLSKPRVGIARHLNVET